uniref:Cytochrome c oxidase subunit 3 n=1 Tax=Diolcogaster sp. SNS-2016 TaxID=1911508 RepID=A0A6F8ACQ3_9HYME|nr:cytochrome c oxidase subunit III [Diolcogaster sp. SNS-2016]
MMMKFNHPFHLVTISPWPLTCSLSLLIFMNGTILFFNEYNFYLMNFGMFLIMLNLFQWWRDIIRESTYQGNHTIKVMKGMKNGMILFIISEIMFFLSLFWTYFHMYLSPSIEIGSNWFPLNLIIFNPYNIPLLNTMILLSSGMTITFCHYSILESKFLKSLLSMLSTIILGMIFSYFQYKEYNESFFSINDSVFGSIFFMLTGFHGMHVLIGTMFNFIIFIRLLNKHFSMYHLFGFEASSWYWHFVDLIWLFLYIILYWMIY